VSNYIQPGSAATSGVTGVPAGNPAPNPAVTVMPHVAGSASGNPLNLTWPLPRYIEPGISGKDDPSGKIRAK
jgi:hypothetical protein